MPLESLSTRPSLAGPKRRHQAVCAECGTSTTVPFRPSQDRPVYCSPCFRTQRDALSSPAGAPARGPSTTNQFPADGAAGPAPGFPEMALRAAIRAALFRMNRSEPMPIQEKSIPLLLAGRMGRSGEAVTFITPDEERKWREIDRGLGGRFVRKPWNASRRVGQRQESTPKQPRLLSSVPVRWRSCPVSKTYSRLG